MIDLTREQIKTVLETAPLTIQGHVQRAREIEALCRMALAYLDAHADHAAEVERLEAELNELKEAVSWEGRDPHLAAWRKECFDRDQSASVLDSDIVSLIDRAGMARTEVARLQERVRVLEEALKGANEQLRMALHLENGSWRKHVADAIRNLKQAKAALAQPPKEKGGKP